VRKAAVLGAGVMGAQIAAHLANADIETLLYDLPGDQGDLSGIAARAIENLKKLQPAPLASPSRAAGIAPANYQQDLERLRDCDLVIEAIAERMDFKLDLYQKIAPFLGERTVFATNTSGLSIAQLSNALPESVQHRFCGVHFFNPPRYMHLVELIAGPATGAPLLDALEKFLVTVLGKGVIRARDTPNFIANRIGVFSMLATMHHAQRLGLGFDVVDALTGRLIGHPRSATFRTADIVGLDTFAHVVATMTDALPDDPWHAYFRIPDWLRRLIDNGALGQKSGRGIYRKVGADIHVLDAATDAYRPSAGRADDEVVTILREADPEVRFERLHASTHPQCEFLWSLHRDLFHYCAVQLAAIADNARDVDLAIRWGFGWERGPFETWQSGGWGRIAQWISRDIRTGRAMAETPLPEWADDPRRAGVHGPQGSYSAAGHGLVARSALRVYARQLFPDRVAGELVQHGTTMFDTAAVRCWHTGDDIAIVSFKSKMHTIGDDVLDGMLQALDTAARECAALVIWQTEPPFSAGANLQKTKADGGARSDSAASKLMRSFRRAAQAAVLHAAHSLNVADKLMAGRLAEVEDLVQRFQLTTQALKYSTVPVIAAVDGLALGGGCEFIMHCAGAVATLESYIGLVEAGVGLLPAGGGCKELALRAAQEARGGDLFAPIRRAFEQVATAQVGRSAEHARELGYLRPQDRIVMNRFELLYVAKSVARMLAEAGYRPPLRARAIPVAGRSVAATLKAYVANLLEGKFISQHDQLIAGKIADTLCGGDVEAGSLVDEQWLLDLEREHFMDLIATEKTQQRIEHTLKTGKPLRN
jgi:3-hydroxyacyl-CoA dehydrogenase